MRTNFICKEFGMRTRSFVKSMAPLFLMLVVGVSDVYGDYNTWLRASTDDTGKGLVYASSIHDQTPADDAYGDLVLSDIIQGSYGAKQTFYGWAKPARGYTFATWTGYKYYGDDAKPSESAATFPSPKQETGVGDLIYSKSWSGSSGDDAAQSVKASWKYATSYSVVYEEPVGGSYTVNYSYVTINSNAKFDSSTETMELSPGSGDKRPYGLPGGSQEDLSYATDVVTLSTNDENFVAWEEDGVEKSAANPYTYPITKHANVTALFKWAEPVAPADKLIRTTNNYTDVNESIVFSMGHIVSDWTTADFTVTLVDAIGSGTFTLGTYSYNATDKELTIPFTYNANGHWDEGSSVSIQVTPIYGTTTSASVRAIAQQNTTNQARVSGDGFTTQEGGIMEMLAIANANTNATLTLLQSVEVSEPLVVTKSMTLDLNNWVLSSTEANTIIRVEGTDTKLTVVDNSFLKGSEIHLTRTANAAIAAIEVTDANRLVYHCGKMTVSNNAEYDSNSDAAAYGIYVSGAGNVVMQGGSVKVESDHDARGVCIAASGYATLNKGAVEALAKTQAYALYSGGKINVEDGVSLTATATSGNEAAALCLSTGTAVVGNVAMTASSASTDAYGVKVTGTVVLTFNGSTITSTAATANAYGLYIAGKGNVTSQQQTNITAKLTDAAGTGVYGVQNVGGTVRLVNCIVTAISPTTNAKAVNTVTAAVKTTIEGGTYTAQSATGTVYGLCHQYGTLTVDGGTFSSIAAGNTVYGVYTKVAGTIKNATVIAEATGSAKNVYGAMCAAKTLTLNNCTIKAKSATSGAYAIHNSGTVKATGCSLIAKTLSSSTACGFYAKKGAATLTNTDAVVDAFTTTAYGIQLVAGTLTVSGGTYDVSANQATATKAADSKVYGVYVTNGLTATLSNASFIVSATNGSFSQKAYGAYTGTGTINSTGCTYSVSAAKQAYGVYGEASSTLNLQNNTIMASTIGTTSALGVYSAGNFTVDGDNVITNTKTYASYSLYFTATAKGEVLGGKFKAEGSSTKSTEILAPINTDASAENVQVKGGFFSDNVRLRYYVPAGYEIYGVDPAAPEYAEEYYYTVNDHLPYENICYITEKNVGFPTLEEAFDYARNHSDATYNIIMTQPYTLPEGNYSLPANATLVVPDRVSRTTAIGTIADRQTPEQDLITENRCLTFAEGANLDVYGTIEVSAKQYTINVGRIAYVLGPYGRIHLEQGSTVTLNNGAKINAWGYITGQGEIRVKNGAEVREFFQVHDMKAASAIPTWTSTDNKNIYKAFLMNQYYIQSIEAPTKYYYGGKLIGSLSITSNATAWVSVDADNVQLVGTDDAFFTVDTDDESSWVRKTYNPTTDRILWETNSSASLGSISVSMMSYGFDSKDYVLPFTNNMTVHALSGIFHITQSVVLLPGSEIIVDKTATLHINEKDVNGDAMGLYLYDKSQWTTAATTAMYSPSWTNGVCPRSTAASGMKDAAIYVKGKIEVEGALYTTEGGAAIYSDEDNAGTIEFSANAGADGNLYQTYDGSVSVPVSAAKLRNGGETGADEDMTVTKDVAQAGDTYAYANIDGSGFKWTRLKTVDACTIADETDPENPVYYAKPQGYVAITSTEEDANHLFHSVVGNRLFIQQGMEAGCQWWEVTETATDGVYHCATNDTYYKYNTIEEAWEEYTVKVTFYFTDPKSEEEGQSKVLTVNYGAKPDAAIVSNPSKAEDAEATYQFYGWKSGNTGTEYSYTAELEPVTEDMYYLPIFNSITKKYTITFKEARNGADAPVEVYYGVHPSYNPFKNPTAQYTYYFQHWLASDETTQYAIDAELPVVTADDHYTAVWAQTANKYSVIWKNGDEVLETDTKQEYGAAVSYDGETPTKETDANFVYTFDGWSLTDGGAELASMPTVNGEMTFFAHFSTTPRYVVIFANYDGTQLQKESVTQGEHPVYNGLTPGRARDVDGYFRFKGWKDSKGTAFAPNATFPVVTGKETYTAQYDYVTELYTITLNNVNNGVSWSGKFGVGATPFYNKSNNDVAATPTKKTTTAATYTFDHWVDSENNEYALNELPAVTGEATYTAVFTSQTRKYNITLKNMDGNAATQQVIAVDYNTTAKNLEILIASVVTPAKEDNYYTYAFTGWSPTLAKVTKAATYTAQFSEAGTPRTFPITFDPDNGVDEPYVVQVPYGEIPSTTDPTKAADEAQSYTFSGWSPALTEVDGPTTYTAQYTPSIRTFVITFKDYDGSTIKTSHFSYGVMPTADDPARPLDEKNRIKYLFSGWTPALTSVTEDATYTATYEELAFVATVTSSTGAITYHSTWAEAFSKANEADNCIIKLYEDVTTTAVSSANVKQSMTIDLNGYTLSCTSETTSYTRMFYISGAYTLTVNDSKGSGNAGKISFTGSGNTNYYLFDVHGSSSVVTINGGILRMNYSGSSASNRGSIAFLYMTNSTININGGELLATASTGKGYAIDHDGSNYGIANISGGKLKASTEIIKDRKMAKNYISGGYFSLIPGTAGSDITIPSGMDICNVPEADPLKAEGYNYKVAPGYTITWLNDDESTIKTENWETGTTPTYIGAEPSKTNQGQYIYTFTGWTPALTTVTKATSYKAMYDITGINADHPNEPVEITENTTLTTTTVRVSGTLTVAENKTLTTTNLILEAGEDNSGQLTGAGTINATNVYYDLKLNTAARHWHAFGVPWNVDVTANPITEEETGRTLVVGRDCEIVYYNGEKRAAQGPGAHCWEYLKHYSEAGQPIDVMTPGKGYMIAFTGAVQTVRFTKATGAPIFFDGSNSVVGGAGEDDGWNAIANPMAYHATLSAGPTVGYVHDGGEIGSDGYAPYDINDKKYIVGKMVYVQAESDQPIVVNPAGDKGIITPAAAPRRTKAASIASKQYLALNDYYAISLSNGDQTSNVYVVPEEGKADKYVIGHDLSQFSMSTQKPQIWVNRYDTKLALNTTALINEAADFPISLYAPTSGDHTVCLNLQPDDEYSVYLTLDGKVIWNLSSSEYKITLTNGVNSHYGIRLSAHKTPSVATGIDEAIIDADGSTRKVLINGQVFIIRGDNVYSIDGQMVK